MDANPKQVETLANYRIRGSKVMGLSLDTSYDNSLVDDTKDALSTVLEITGGVSL